MNTEIELRRKYTLRAHGHQMVFIKKSFESSIHVLTKAFLWALYLPDYPNLAVEVPVGGRYKPDLVQFDEAFEKVRFPVPLALGRSPYDLHADRVSSFSEVF